MQIAIRLSVSGEAVKEAVISVEDAKFEELSDEERESAVEIIVRNWADHHLRLEWETIEDERMGEEY